MKHQVYANMQSQHHGPFKMYLPPLYILHDLYHIKSQFWSLYNHQHPLVHSPSSSVFSGTSSTAATPWRTPRPRSTCGSRPRSLSPTPPVPSPGCTSKLANHQPVNYTQLDPIHPTDPTPVTPVFPAVDPLTWSSLINPKHVALINKVSC